MSWEDILKKDIWDQLLGVDFVIWAKTDDSDNWEVIVRGLGSREEAFESVKREAKKMGRTVVGSASEGKMVVMNEGIFENITEQIIYYSIRPDGYSAPSPSHIPDTSETQTPSGTRRRLEGDFETGEKY